MRQSGFTLVRSLLLSTSCLSLFALSSSPLHSQPTGGTVAAGQASISNVGANSTIIQQTSNKALINWQAFSIAAGGTVQFNQPNSSSITLNRVIGASASSIDGSLLANGQVWLINANGILFGKGSTINVAGLLATTADIADSDFISGNYNFSAGSGASVVNQGTIRTQSGGSAVLSAARVVNQGLIEADSGTVVLGGASAFTVDFNGDNLLRYAITAPAGRATDGQTGVNNSGTIAASGGGRVLMTARAAANVTDSVVNNTGLIEANSAHLQNGEVVLDAGEGTVNAGGSIDASGAGQGETGGTVAITGAIVNVADNTQIDVSGDVGGGTVNIGGAAHGGATLQAANNTTVGNATIKADALSSGNGGSLVVWSNGITDFSGVFSATGGTASGNGGNIETSGATLHIAPSAKVNTTAANGAAGTWLLDPLNIVIANGGGTPLSGGTLAIGTDPGLTDTIAPSTITSALATTNVTLEASNDITVTNGFSYSSTFSLNLFAMHDITVNDSIQNTLASAGGAINLVAGWDGTTLNPVLFGNSGVYGNNSGTFSIIGTATGVAIGARSGATNVYADSVTLDATNGYAQLGYHGAGGGAILVRALGALTITAGAGASDFAMIGNGSTLGDVAGSITGNIDIRAVGNSTLSGGSGSGNIPWIGNVATSPDTETGSVTFVTSSINEQGGGFGQNVAVDVVGGDVTVGITNPNQADGINHAIIYNSPHTVNVLTAGTFEIDAPLQNSGSGAINFVTGWDGTTLDPAHFGDAGVYGNNAKGFVIGGNNAAGDAAFGSATGPTSVYAANVSILAVNGYAQFGYHGAGTGSIAVNTLGDLIVSANPFVAELGNGGTDVAASSGGAITINAGGNVTVDEVSQGATLGIAAIGNLGGGGSSSQSGNISVTAGQALTVESEAGFAFIGNTSAVSTTGGATGTIAINASSVDIETVGQGFRAAIGDGARRLNQGTTGGDINITGATLDLVGSSDPSAGGQVRIGSFGAGPVVGNINITTTGDINLFAPSGELASIGNSDNGSSTTSGNISVHSGGAITLTALGNGIARIFAGLAPNSNINVTAAADVTLLTTADEFASTGAQAYIGSFANGLDAVAGNVTISSTNSGINLLATEDSSFVIVGNQAGAPTTAGTLTINAPNGTLSLLASGTGAQATIGNDGSTGDAGGNINVSSAGVSLSASGNTSQVQIGNGGPFMVGSVSGSITLTDSGDLDVIADGTGAFAQIGNGDPLHTGTSNGSVGGDINLQVTGSSLLGGVAGTPWVGNLADGAGVESGNVVWVSHTLDGGAAFQTLIASDLSGGDFTLGITDPTSTNNINSGLVYNSPHNLTLLSAGSINIQSTIENNGSGALTLVAGWNPSVAPANVATTAGAYGNNNQSITIGGAGGVGNVSFGSAAGAVTVLGYDVLIDGANGYAQLGYHGPGGGAINLTATHDLSMTTSSGYAMIGNGSLNSDVSGNVGGDITIQVGGIVHDNDSVGNPVFFGNATASGTETGNLVMVMSSEDGTSSDALGNSVRTDLTGGDVTLGFTSTSSTGPSHDYAVDTPHTLNLLSAGDLVIAGNVQNSGTGAINLVAGWDGHTLAPASFGTAGVFGNNAGAVLIGGTHATSNVAVGSAGGTTSVFAASLTLSATNGYAQLGLNGSGTGAIFVTVSGGVTLTGGSSAGQFAQIGNGGLNTSGNNAGDIGITAGGDVTLAGGAGTDAYAQVGHGGDQSNSNSAGYNNVAPITIAAANVVLDAGSGNASYVQIGNGGFKSGAGLTSGTATNGGDIMITSAHAVTLLANGADAYAQIGNGGDQSNLNPAAAAGGVDSGDIVVQAPSGAAGAVMLTAGSGANAYAQIGNGGYSANAGVNAVVANFTMLGSVSVTDLSLAGGNTSGNSYSQIGNGDAALASAGNVSGDLVIAANGNITYTNGSAQHSPAVIGNFTGQGTSTGTVAGASPPPTTIVSSPGVVGVIATLLSNPTTNAASNPNNSVLTGPVTLVETEVAPLVAENAAGAAGVGLAVTTQGPIASLSGESEETPNTSDSATVVIADSLNGADKPSTSKSLMGGYLTQVTPAAANQTIHGIPPADQDFSSWGNEALWR